MGFGGMVVAVNGAEGVPQHESPSGAPSFSVALLRRAASLRTGAGHRPEPARLGCGYEDEGEVVVGKGGEAARQAPAGAPPRARRRAQAAASLGRGRGAGGSR